MSRNNPVFINVPFAGDPHCSQDTGVRETQGMTCCSAVSRPS
jgi:hypothetical protein